MAYTSKKLIAENIRRNLREYRTLFEETAEASRLEAMQQLKPGQPVPQRGRIYGDAYRQSFTQAARVIRNKALGVLAEWSEEISSLKTDAPSEAALRAIQLFQMRDTKSMSREELAQEANALVDRYGGCYQAYRVIQDIARKEDVYIKPHPVAADVEAFETVKKGVTDFMAGVDAFGGNGPSAGKEAFFSMMLDKIMGTDAEE